MRQDTSLDVKNLCKDYGGFALRDVSFSIPEGYIMGLIGPNGAGKTTTINLILNLIGRDSGQVCVLGMDNAKQDAAIKQQVGVVFDSSIFVEDWKVSDAGNAMALFYDDWNRVHFGELLAEFSLDPAKKVKELSRGMQTKLMLACAALPPALRDWCAPGNLPPRLPAACWTRSPLTISWSLPQRRAPSHDGSS